MNVCFLFSFFIIRSVHADTLTDLIDTGLERSFDVKQQKIKVSEAHNLKLNAYAQLLPALSLSAARSYSRSQDVDSGVKSWGSSQSDSLSINADWTLWNNFQNLTDIKLSNNTETSTKLQANLEIQNFTLKVIEAYLTYQLNLNQKKSTELLLQQAQKAMEEIEIQIKHGAKSSVEILDAEIDVINAKRDLIEIQNTINSTKRNLAFLLSIQESELKLDQIDIANYSPFFIEKFKRIYNEKNNIELENQNKEFAIAKLDLEKAALTYNQESLSTWPSLSLSLSDSIDFSQYTKKYIASEDKTSLHNLSISLNLTWQLFDFFSTSRTKENSYKEFEISQMNFKENEFRIKNDVINLFEQYDLLEKSLTTSRIILEKAEKHYEYSSVMYKYGKISLLARQKAMNQLFDAKLELQERIKKQITTSAQIIIALGENIYQ